MKKQIMNLVAGAAILATTPAFCMELEDSNLSVRVRFEAGSMNLAYNKVGFVLRFGQSDPAFDSKLDFEWNPETNKFNTHSITVKHNPRDPIVWYVKPDDKLAKLTGRPAKLIGPSDGAPDDFFKVRPLTDLAHEPGRREIVRTGKTVCLNISTGNNLYITRGLGCLLYIE